MRKLHLLERFRVTAEEGSMHTAARRLGITQPALTKSIQALEEEYNLPLFDRHARGVTLSAFGRRLFAHVKVIDREIQLADADLTHLQTGKAGTLSIGGGVTWTTVFLPPIIARLQQAFPEVHVNLTTGPNRSLVQHLLDGDIDLTVGGLREEAENLPPFLIKRPLLSLRSKVVARRDHPLRQSHPVRNASLNDYPWIIHKGDLGSLEIGREQIRRLTGGLPRAILYSGSVLALANLVETGDYLASLPPPLLGSLKRFAIEPLAIERESLSYQTGVIYRDGLASVAPFSFLLDALDELASDESLQQSLL